MCKFFQASVIESLFKKMFHMTKQVKEWRNRLHFFTWKSFKVVLQKGTYTGWEEFAAILVLNRSPY